MSQRETRDHKPRENHATTVLTSGQPAGSFAHQRVLAHTAIFVDLFIDGRLGVSPVWGPLVPFMEGHLVAVEFVSGTLSRSHLSQYFAEAQLLLHNESDATLSPTGGRLIVNCHDAPRARLAELAAYLRPSPTPGIWHVDLGAAGQAILCAADHLPDAPGNSCLRFAVAKPPHAEHVSRLFAVMRDHTLPSHLRLDAIRRAHMLDATRTPFAELPLWKELMAELERQTPRILAEQRAEAVERGIERGMERGIERGIVQGVDQTVERLLAVAAERLPAEQVAELRRRRDPVEIALAMADAGR